MIHICLPETQPYELKIATEICTEREKNKHPASATIQRQNYVGGIFILRLVYFQSNLLCTTCKLVQEVCILKFQSALPICFESKSSITYRFSLFLGGGFDKFHDILPSGNSNLVLMSPPLNFSCKEI